MKWVLLAVLAALIPAAVVFRRKINDPKTPLGRWFEEHIRPRSKDAIMGVFILTFLVWAAVYVLAPEEDRDSLGQALKGFWEQVDPEPEPGPTAPDRPMPSATPATPAIPAPGK